MKQSRRSWLIFRYWGAAQNSKAASAGSDKICELPEGRQTQFGNGFFEYRGWRCPALTVMVTGPFDNFQIGVEPGGG
jgi:hypothetical protein